MSRFDELKKDLAYCLILGGVVGLAGLTRKDSHAFSYNGCLDSMPGYECSVIVDKNGRKVERKMIALHKLEDGREVAYVTANWNLDSGAWNIQTNRTEREGAVDRCITPDLCDRIYREAVRAKEKANNIK
ncbi:MAG: hypothetical protein AABX11_02965 [Nanoarchaeota archaeon]